jgi:hypothetical protein
MVDTFGDRRGVLLLDTEGHRPSSIETGGVRPRDALRASVLLGAREADVFDACDVFLNIQTKILSKKD